MWFRGGSSWDWLGSRELRGLCSSLKGDFGFLDTRMPWTKLSGLRNVYLTPSPLPSWSYLQSAGSGYSPWSRADLDLTKLGNWDLANSHSSWEYGPGVWCVQTQDAVRIWGLRASLAVVMQCSQVSSRGRGAIFWGTEPAAALCFLTVSPHHSLELRVQTIAPWLESAC